MQPPIKIPYSTLPAMSPDLWPIVEIEVVTAKGKASQWIKALVDSGANVSVLHPDIARVLGFDLRKASSEQGVSASGGYRSWVLPEPIEVRLYGFTFRRRFVAIDNPSFSWPCILGQNSIFDVARIDFYKFKSSFDLRFRSDIH